MNDTESVARDPVVCFCCRKPLYYCSAIGRKSSGDTIEASDMEPVSPDIVPPTEGEEMRCPYCGNVFLCVGPQYACLLLESGAWWPFPPLHKSLLEAE